MKSIRYYVAHCDKCNRLVLVKVKFIEFEEECCVDFRNLKLMKMFNDEEEAKNYIKLYTKDEEKE